MSCWSRVNFNHYLENIGRGELLKQVFWSCFKLGLLILVILSSALAIYIRHQGKGFDPVREIQKLRDDNRRDDALDMARFYRENKVGDNEKIKKLEKDLEYTPLEKMKSFVWEGAVKGEVHDTYSGIGAMSADLCIIGDLRDVGIQSWKFITNNADFDELVLLLSTVGLALSSKPLLHVCDSLAKNSFKYLRKIRGYARTGVLRKLLARKLSKRDYLKVFDLFKKTNGLYPEPLPVLQTLTT